MEAFAAAREAGIGVVLVTGRPVRWLAPVSDRLGRIGPVICSNGAVTYDVATNAVIEENPMSGRLLFAAKDLITGIDPHATFAAETFDHLHLEEHFIEDSLFFEEDRRKAAGVTEDQLAFGPLDETLQRSTLTQHRHISDRVLKLLVKSRAMDPDDFLMQVRHRVGHLVSVTHSAPGVSLLELSAHGVNKAAALRRFAAAQGIAQDEVIAFGDMPNDIEMLQWAGTSWAVGTAHPMARSAADHTAPGCDDDGVAQVIEQLLSHGQRG